MATILIIDDQPINLKVLVDLLRKQDYHLLVAEDGQRALELLEKQNPDIILLDIMMPGMDGFAVCKAIKQKKALADIPIIFLTALADVENKIKAFQCGGVDFITKPFQEQEVLMRVNTHLTIRRQQKQIEREKELLAVTLRSIGDGVIATDTRGKVTLINKVAEDLTGWSQEDAAGKPLPEIFHIINEKTGKPCENPVTIVLDTGRSVSRENHKTLIAKDGSKCSIADSGAPISDSNQQTIGTVLVFRDVSQERRFLEELEKVKKLESVGVLAGGIAHDFNNILTGITGNLSLATLQLEPGHSAGKFVQTAEKATFRASLLTKQLLTFAKGGEPIKESSSIYEIIQDSCEFSLVGSAVDCKIKCTKELWNSDIDKGQISQVMQNLIINSSQAMPGGGSINVLCENYPHNAAENRELPLPAGDYIRVRVKDNGAGIPTTALKNIFDPYFTTKQEGRGLGLAVCYAIIKKHQGLISCHSELGHGTTFTIYLPASDKAAVKQETSQVSPSGKGRILLMDDDETIRDVAEHMLAALGYSVDSACDGEETLSKYKEAMEKQESFLVVIMDLTIPGGMGGAEAAQKLIKIDPQAKIIVASGYSNDPIMANYQDYDFCSAIAKPFDIHNMGRTIAAVLSI